MKKIKMYYNKNKDTDYIVIAIRGEHFGGVMALEFILLNYILAIDIIR
jgi:hypothetical protein